MPIPPRSILGRMSAALGTSAWLLALAFVACFSSTMRTLAADVPVHEHTLHATDQTMQVGVGVQVLNASLEGWAVAVTAFGVFAVSAVLASLGIWTGRRAMATSTSTAAATGLATGGLYLCLLGVVLTAGLL